MADPTPPPQGDTPPPMLTDANKVMQWLSRTYFSYKHADAHLESPFNLSMREFTQISALDYWFSGEVMSLSLALSTDSHNRAGDVLVLSTNSTQPLYSLGLGAYTIEDIKTLPLLYNGVIDPTKRWIVIPCSDGTLESEPLEKQYKDQMNNENELTPANNEVVSDPIVPAKTTVETTRVLKKKKLSKRQEDAAKRKKQKEEAAKKKKEEEEAAKKKKKEEEEARKKKEQEAKVSARPVGHGTHWGLLIVDKQQKVAHWVDSYMTVGLDRGKWRITNMLNSAMVGGKVLCGIDAILSQQDNFEKGKFNASTLKYVPNQNLDNDCYEDNGACGPFTFAFLHHLYKNPAKMESLRASFPRSGRRGLRFDSLDQREEVQRLIQQAANDKKDDELPFNLTLDLLNVLGFLSTSHVSEMARGFRDPTKPPPRRPAGGNKRKRGDGDDDEDDDSDSDGAFGDPPIPKNIIRDAIRGSGSTYKDIADKNQRYQMVHDNLMQEEREALEQAKKNAKKDAAKKEAARKIAADAKAASELATQEKARVLPPAPTLRSIIQFPDNVTELPNDFANEKKVPEKLLKKWVTANQELLGKMDLGKKSTDISERAALQALVGVDFEKETDTRLETIWLQDPTVFNPNDEESLLGWPGLIAKRMKDKYNIFQVETENKLDYATDQVAREGITSEDELGEGSEPGLGEGPAFKPAPTKKRKRDPTELVESAKKLKLSPPDFLNLDIAYLRKWIEVLKPHRITRPFIKFEPTVKGEARKENEIEVKNPLGASIMLERAFNRTLQNMALENPLSDESYKIVRGWKFKMRTLGEKYNGKSRKSMKKFLDECLMTEKWGEVPDHSSRYDMYPEYYLQKCVEEEEAKRKKKDKKNGGEPKGTGGGEPKK